MSAERIFVPSYPYNENEHGLFTGFNPSTTTLPAGHKIAPQFKALTTDIVFERDIAVTLRDGVTIYVDVFRPTGSEKLPVIVAWSPYGKSGGSSVRTTSLFTMLGMDNELVSGLEKFEGPDPAYWCAHGYAVCNPDARGIAHCDGDSVMLGRQEGQDCYDVIEWLAVQTWCTGKVAMSGTSYLTMMQWFTAAEQPPHLTVINPWEGLTDAYRDLVMEGGIPDFGFPERLQHNYAGKGQREDIVAEAKRHPLVNELWEDKAARLDKIIVPAYVVASYSNTLHTAGTFRAWRRIASQEKWLRIHNTLEWPDYYDSFHVEDLRRFFDHYLKGEQNGWEQTSRVRYSVLDMKGGDRTNLPATTFPPEGVLDTKFYLNGSTRSLVREVPSNASTVVYDAQTQPGLASFIIRFETETVMVGYPKLRLWVEAKDADDMDLFFLVQKLDALGNHLQQFNIPNQGAMMQDATERGGTVLRYKGSPGRLRVSARHLDPASSTETVPEHSFDRIEKLSPGEIVDIEVGLLPLGLVFYPGEQLRLIIDSQNALGAIMPGVGGYVSRNRGQHVIHAGGAHGSYLQLPLKVA